MPEQNAQSPLERDPSAGPPLSVADITAWVGETSLARGMPYVAGAIFNTRRTGLTLKAQCQGTATQPYRVAATLGPQGGIVDSSCTCPVAPRCKHVAALLLTWRDDPGAFIEVEALDTALERRDRPELIALIRQMLARHPELETLLELPLPAPGKRSPPADTERIRRQVSAAFRAAGDDWHGAAAVADALDPLVLIGDDYLRLGDWRSAASVYQTIVEGVARHYEEVEDEGDLSGIVDRCVEGLGECLAAASEPAERESLLRALFDIYYQDVDYGGIGMGDAVPGIILDQATGAERRVVAGWVRDRMPGGSEWSDDWHRQVLGGFLLQLAGDDLDDEAFLQICRETGRRRDLVERLLALGRADAAETEVRQAGDNELLGLADLLRRWDHAGRAERLVRERSAAAPGSVAFTQWLRAMARERGDLAEVQALTARLFWQHPGLSVYEELRDSARAHGSWDTLRPELLGRLEREQQHALLTEIHLLEGEVAAALATLPEMSGWPGYGYGQAPLPIRVAQAAEAEHPREAIALYQAAAERLIRAQGRENYVLAARYLMRVRDLYQRLGEGAAWSALIATIREQHRRLRALREELDRARL